MRLLLRASRRSVQCSKDEGARTGRLFSTGAGAAPLTLAGRDAHRQSKSSRIIPLAVDARRQRFPHEAPYAYQPLADTPVAWNDAGRRDVLHHYQRRMIGI